MICSRFQVAAIFFAAVGFFLILGAVASSSWMMGCIEYANIFKAAKNFLNATGKPIPPDFEAAEKLMGWRLYIYQGLFKLSFQVEGLITVSLPVNASTLAAYAIFSGVALIVGLVLALAAIVLLLMAASGQSESYEMKSQIVRRNRIAMVLSGAAVLAATAGMVSYAAGSAPYLHEPLAFISQIRGGASEISKLFDENEASFEDSTNRAGIEAEPSSGFNSTIMQEYLTTLSAGLDPVHGHSFVVGWVSVVFLLLSLIFAVCARQHFLSQP